VLSEETAGQCIPSESTGKSAMSNLVVLGFDGIHTADEVLNKLRSLQKEYLIDLEDACVVERLENGKAFINQAVNLIAIAAAAGGGRGALWGTLVGLLFLNPLAGMAIGAITGAGYRRKGFDVGRQLALRPLHRRAFLIFWKVRKHWVAAASLQSALSS
jgi:Protein of unknown function (DUF1269)